MKKRILSKYDGKKLDWLKTAKEAVIAVVLAILVFNFLVGVSVVDGDSMQPTLQNGDLVFYVRVGTGYGRGDLVSIKMPSGEYYVKRIIAVEGDVIDIREDGVYLNEELLSEPYIAGRTHDREELLDYPYRVEANSVFVMGDNRDVSADSRTFGAILTDQIKGKLLTGTQ